jgi:hypothetical protein
MISIQILSWNRPIRLFLTLLSLKRVLRFSKLKYELLILDQNSNWITKFLIKRFNFNKKIFLDENIGMAKAWQYLFRNTDSNANYVLQLENDWWCLSINDSFLITAIKALEKNDCAFVKLRKNFDLQAGTNLINKEPQTIYPLPFNIFQINYFKDSFCLYSKSSYSCFTFNPTLMKIEFRIQVEDLYLDNKDSNINVLRSGEDIPTHYWENQSIWNSAIISNPAFVHTGFHSRRYVYLKVPIFYLIEITLCFYSFFKLLRFNRSKC